MGCIYKITNTVNDKSYIGQTRHDVKKTRIRKHLNGNGNRIIKQAIAKYGQSAFTYEILHERPEVRQKVSEAKRSPYYNPARRVFYGLPETLTLQEKRKILFAQFTEVTKRTVYNWVGKWTSIS